MVKDIDMDSAKAGAAGGGAIGDESKLSSSDTATSTVQADIEHNLTLLRSAVTLLEPRLTSKVLRTTASIRKRLSASSLREVIVKSFPQSDKHKLILLGYLSSSMSNGTGMHVDATASTIASSVVSAVTDKLGLTDSKGSHLRSDPTTRASTPQDRSSMNLDFPPELDVYLSYLVILHLVDTNDAQKSLDLAEAIINRLSSQNRRTLDHLAAKVWSQYSRLCEINGGPKAASNLRPQLLAAQRLAALRRDDDLQATLLNLLLRNYFSQNLYEQADKLIAKAKFPEGAGNPQLARWLYYVGRIRAIQLNYTEAHTLLQQAIRRAPNATVAPGFLQTINKLFITVELLMGEIPERGIFRQPVLQKPLVPYLQIVQAVRVGDLAAFSSALKTHKARFSTDGTYTLISRLRHNVIKTALRALSLAYSRIPLQEVCLRLHLDSEEEAEYICAKAIRDGVIEASLDHEKGFMRSREVADVYATNEPQKAFHQRIDFCMQLHNDSIKAMRFPMKSHQKELSKAADARERQRELATEIEQNGPGEDDDDEGPEI